MADEEALATRVDEDTKTRFRVEAARRNLDMSELLRIVVRDWLDEHEGEDIT